LSDLHVTAGFRSTAFHTLTVLAADVGLDTGLAGVSA
jgi:hypothetical protein